MKSTSSQKDHDQFFIQINLFVLKKILADFVKKFNVLSHQMS